MSGSTLEERAEKLLMALVPCASLAEERVQILSALQDEGKATLEEAAGMTCGECGRGRKPHHSPYRKVQGPDDWWHDDGIRCHAGRLHDALALTSQEGGR